MADEPVAGRDVLPIPDIPPVGLTTFDAKDPDTHYPPIVPLRRPKGAPNVLIIPDGGADGVLLAQGGITAISDLAAESGGEIIKVVFDVKDDAYVDVVQLLAAAMARD